MKLDNVVDPAVLLVYQLYRERVSQEDVLVNHRMGWLLWSNAILFAFFVGLTSVPSADRAALKALLLVGPWVVVAAGAACTIGSMLVIRAALQEIEHLCVIYTERHPENARAEAERRIPRLVGHQNHHVVGKCVPLLMPIVMLLLWVALGILKGAG